MATINTTGQLLLPLVGVTRKELEKYKVEISNVDFRYAPYSRRSTPYTLFIRILRNMDFIRFLKEERSLIKFYTEGDENIVMLECLPTNKDDWRVILQGKYSKMSYKSRQKILKNVAESKKDWERVFRRNKTDILEAIEQKLQGTKYTPIKRREVAEDLYEEINLETYELFPKLKKGFI